jgi:hypothetical protein
MHSPTSHLPKQQQGASALSVLIIIMALIVGFKLFMAIVPAQINDYQMSKLITAELERANADKKTSAEFMKSLAAQLSINADYDTKVEDVITITNKQVGALAVQKKYSTTHNFFGNVDIVNRFEETLPAAELP